MQFLCINDISGDGEASCRLTVDAVRDEFEVE